MWKIGLLHFYNNDDAPFPVLIVIDFSPIIFQSWLSILFPLISEQRIEISIIDKTVYSFYIVKIYSYIIMVE